jgi:hypothetical protein
MPPKPTDTVYPSRKQSRLKNWREESNVYYLWRNLWVKLSMVAGSILHVRSGSCPLVGDADQKLRPVKIHYRPYVFWEPGQRSEYSFSLRAGRCGDQIQVGGEIFHTRPDWSWSPLILQYNGCRVCFPGGRASGTWRLHPPHLAPRLKKEYSYTSTSPLCLYGGL